MSNKNLAFAGAFACAALATAAAAMYYLKQSNKQVTIEENDEPDNKLTDPHFSTQNLPLYSTEAEKRDKILTNVSYDLTIALSDK